MSRHQTLHFNSIEALCAAAVEPSAWGSPRYSVSNDYDFTGTRTVEEAIDLARNGWAEGLAKMKLALESVSASSSALGVAPSYSLDVCGAFPLVPAALAGDPLNMWNPAPINERARPILRIATSTALSSSYGVHEVFNYGAALVAVVDALEAAGFSVELMTCRCNMASNSGHAGKRLTITTKIKGAGEPLDLERLAFCLGSASYNRRLHFGVVESRCDEGPWSHSYGQAATPKHGADLDQDVTILAGPTAFGAGSKALSTPEAAFDAMLPLTLSLLRDRYGDLPALKLTRDKIAA